MRRNRELNSWEKKDLARRKYAERQLQKYIDWSIESKGYLKYKDLIKYSEKYGTSTVSAKIYKPKVRRKGVHAKTKTSSSTSSILYKKKYKGQGR